MTSLEQAREAVESRQYEKAFELYERAANENLQASQVYIEMATTCCRLGKVRNAIDAYLHALADLQERNLLDEAMRICNRVLQIDPICLRAHESRQALLDKLGDREAFIAASLKLSRLSIELTACPCRPLERAVERYPDSMELHLALGEAYISVGDIARSTGELRLAAAEAGDPKTRERALFLLSCIQP